MPSSTANKRHGNHRQLPLSTSSRFRFLHVYDALPADAQQLLVHNQLLPLLDAVSTDKQRKAIASAIELQRQYARVPSLNLDAKKAEIASLLLELSRDSKRSLIKERSRREQLLSEAVDTLSQWLNDIWKVVFEFRTNFRAAHACLLFACDALEQIGNGCGGCRCSYSGMFIPIRIRRSTGKVVKSFMLNGVQNLEIVMLWIWRDLFMIILATGSRYQRSTVPDMIRDIRVLLGWRALEQLLRGGSKPVLYEEDSDDAEQHFVAHTLQTIGRRTDDNDDDQDYISDECSSVCDEQLHPTCFYAAHWSWRITDQQSRLRDLVHTALLDMFKVAPSGPLYASMIAIADDEYDLDEQLHPLLMSVAGHSSDNLSAALRILSLKDRPDSVHKLVQSHKHLLRPQDAPSLQLAVLITSSDPCYRVTAMTIAEEELLDVSKEFHAAIRLSFCNIDSETYKAEVAQILALRQDSLNRRTRVERWVKGILTPRADSTHPMALAALMMGIPLPPGADGPDEGDMLGYFEVDGDDPELEDLREEFRPNIRGRLHGWVETTTAIRGGPAILSRVYANIILDMPFLKASDIIDEMCSRIADRPSKLHVFDALEAFRDFCEKQRLKLAATKAKAKAKTRPNAGAATATASTSTNAGRGRGRGRGRGTAPSRVPVFGLEMPLEESDPIRDLD